MTFTKHKQREQEWVNKILNPNGVVGHRGDVGPAGEPSLRDIWFKFCVKNKLCTDPFENKRDGEDIPRNTRFIPNPNTYMPKPDGIPEYGKAINKNLKNAIEELRDQLGVIDFTTEY